VIFLKFGEMIKERRIDLGMTMTEVAKKIEISVPFVSDLEKGNRLLSNAETYDKLVDVLGLEEKKWELLYLLCLERNNIELYMIDGLLHGKTNLGENDKEYMRNEDNKT
jgi:transcriptional regulator with XRE-family HTH domain